MMPSIEIFDVENGFVGVMRDIFCLLVKKIGWGDENKIRSVCCFFFFFY
jgi:hypothetical protein